MSGPSLLIVGAGLIGTSIALAATRAGWRVALEDTDEDRRTEAAALVEAERQRRATRRAPSAFSVPTLTAGSDDGGALDAEARYPATGSAAIDLICVAVPPALNVRVVAAVLRAHVDATVMDVCSVKSLSQPDIEVMSSDLARVVWTHPLAGAEGSGPGAARADLFGGRSWVVCDDAPGSSDGLRGAPFGLPSDSARTLVARLIEDCGARPLAMSAGLHDELLAMTSHVPQLVASALASEVVGAFHAGAFGPDGPPDQTAETRPPVSLLAGPGLLDMTRIAGSPSELWGQIAVLNRRRVRAGLQRVAARLTALEVELADAASTRPAVLALVDEGRAARTEIDRKHAGTADGHDAAAPPREWSWVRATIADVPGTLARVFAVAGELGVNIEDVQVDHAPYASQGVVSVAVRPADAARLASHL